MLRSDLSVPARLGLALRRKPKVGDRVWWRGMSFEVVSTRPAQLLYTYVNEHYRCTSDVREAVWNEDIGYWTMPGVEGEMPKRGRDGELSFPEQPRCTVCGAVTFRKDVCTNCRRDGKAPPSSIVGGLH